MKRYVLKDIYQIPGAEFESKTLERSVINSLIEKGRHDAFIEHGKMQPSAWFEDKRAIKDDVDRPQKNSYKRV